MFSAFSKEKNKQGKHLQSCFSNFRRKEMRDSRPAPLFINFLTFLHKVNIAKLSNAPLPNMVKPIPTNLPSAQWIATEYLKAGSVIALPTDTVYGLACDATDSLAIKQLYEIKSRNTHKPIAICVADITDINTWANVTHISENLLNALLPGPVTLILPCINYSLDKSVLRQGKIAIRIPDYDFIRHLTRNLGKPLALTSANLSNEPSAVEVSDFSEIWDKIPAIFDGGKLNINKAASTIIDLSIPNVYRIIRQGAAYEKLEEILTSFNLRKSNVMT